MAPGLQSRPTGGALSVAISNGIVQLLRQYTGRGPTKARTSIGCDHVLVVVRDALTTGERQLVDAGYGDEVMVTRRHYQQLMGPDATRLVEELTGRAVIGFMSDNHADPDLGIEVFILEPSEDATVIEEGAASNGR
jgi:uncharacterized protein YbcI